MQVKLCQLLIKILLKVYYIFSLQRLGIYLKVDIQKVIASFNKYIALYIELDSIWSQVQECAVYCLAVLPGAGSLLQGSRDGETCPFALIVRREAVFLLQCNPPRPDRAYLIWVLDCVDRHCVMYGTCPRPYPAQTPVLFLCPHGFYI